MSIRSWAADINNVDAGHNKKNVGNVERLFE
jgi:hypothetical protein